MPLEKMTKRRIYLDNAATTQVDFRVFEVIKPYFIEKYGNPSSSHSFGRLTKNAIENSRAIIAKSINAKTEEIVFTSGGTEANNLALKGLWFAHKESGKNHIITSKIEHDSVLEVCKWLEKQGAKITYLDVNSEGFIDLNQLKNSIIPQTLVVSIIHGNNEIGTIQNLEEIGKICKEKKVYFHTDACQSYTKAKLDVTTQNIDLVTLNAHKIHGPKGVGALYIRNNVKITPILHGGGHERGLRSGTENTSGIIGFGKAVEISDIDCNKIKKLRDGLIREILSIEKTKLNGSAEKRLCNNINVSFTNIEGEAIAERLEQYGIYVSTGSACASHSLKKSHVLRAIGLTDLEINSSIRISLSKFTEKKDLNYLVTILNQVVKQLREISPFN